MDGYGTFFAELAVIAGLLALSAGAAIRRPVVAVIVPVAAIIFLGVFAYVFWTLGGLGLSAGIAIAGWTTGFVFPLICVAVLLGRRLSNLFNRKA